MLSNKNRRKNTQFCRKCALEETQCTDRRVFFYGTIRGLAGQVCTCRALAAALLALITVGAAVVPVAYAAPVGAGITSRNVLAHR